MSSSWEVACITADSAAVSCSGRRVAAAAVAARAASVVVELPFTCPLPPGGDVPLILSSSSVKEWSTVGEEMIVIVGGYLIA